MPSQSAICLSELRAPLPPIVLPPKTPANRGASEGLSEKEDEDQLRNELCKREGREFACESERLN